MLALAVMACLFATTECVEKVAVQDHWIAVYRNYPLTEAKQAHIKRAFLMVHGTNRNADDYYLHALSSALSGGVLNETLVAAPRFRAKDAACQDSIEPGEAAWNCEGWKSGQASLNRSPGQRAVFSFDFMDRLLDLLSDRSRFPNLKEIILAGHSAGGQYVHRYSLAGRAEANVKVRFVVANPSSYTYIDEKRPRPRTVCNEKGGCTGEFSLYWDAENCPSYTAYPKGLESLSGYAAEFSPEKLRSRLLERDVLYLVGDLDTQRDANLDGSCPAVAQGQNRRERGVNYWNYLKQNNAGHRLQVVNGCGHSGACMFTTPSAVRAVFAP